MNPDVDDVYVNRDGTIRWDGVAIGHVVRVTDPSDSRFTWRAEIGDVLADANAWPAYAVAYSRTRRGAVAGVLDGVEAPA